MNEQPVSSTGKDLDKIERGQQESQLFAGTEAIAPGPSVPRGATPASDASAQLMEASWSAIKRLPAYARVAAAFARDPRVPAQAKASLAVGGLYLVSPFDLVPGFIPVFGQLDDIYILLTAIQIAAKATPADVTAAHFDHAGITPANIETDLATVRLFVRTAAVKTVTIGGKIIGRAGENVSTLVKKTMNRRGEATHEQKSF
ncbi:MAG: YkvA family protein [Thermomicrobiales bacterium]